MIRIVIVLLMVGALGYAARWLFTRRSGASKRGGIPQAETGGPPRSAARRFFASALQALLIGAAIVGAVFLAKTLLLRGSVLTDEKQAMVAEALPTRFAPQQAGSSPRC